MNVVFSLLTLISLVSFCVFSPDKALPAMLDGVNKAVSLTFTLVPIYAVWTALYKILELCGVTSACARFLKKPIRRLFGKTSDKALEYVSLNVSANILGLGGVATPLGIKACRELENENNPKAADLLLVLASTSLQILPISVIALMISYGSKNYSSIILPGFISTAFSTVTGVIMFKALSAVRRPGRRRKQ